jgi:geranylgeranyl diphosphate synthase type I
MEEAGSIQFARDYAAALILESKGDLESSVPPSDARDLLASMADFFVKRDT